MRYPPRTIYLAGPFFTPDQVATMTTLYDFLTGQGFEVNSAFKDGVNLAIAYQTIRTQTPSTTTASELVYYLNVAISSFDIWNALVFGDMTVANVSPLQPSVSTNEDSGTVVEACYAACFSHPVIYWNDSLDRLIPQDTFYYNGFPNPMMNLNVNIWNVSPQTVDNVFAGYATNDLGVLRQRLALYPLVSPQKDGFPPIIQNRTDLGALVAEIMRGNNVSALINSTNYPLLVRVSTEARKNRERFNIPPWNGLDFVSTWPPPPA